MLPSKTCPAKTTAIPNLWRSFGLKPKFWRADASSQFGGIYETSGAYTLAIASPGILAPYPLDAFQSSHHFPLILSYSVVTFHGRRPLSFLRRLELAGASPKAPPLHHLFR